MQRKVSEDLAKASASAVDSSNLGQAPGMERTSNAARWDGSTPKQGKLFLREPEILVAR